MFLQILLWGWTYKIGRDKQKFDGTPRLLPWLVRLGCRLADPAPMPVWLARLGCPVGWLVSVAQLDCSAPPTYLLVRSEFPARCFFSAARVVGSAQQPNSWLDPASRLAGLARLAGCLARLRWPTGCLGSAARLAGTAGEARHRDLQYPVGFPVFLQILLWDRTYKLCYNSLWLSIAKQWKFIVHFNLVF